MIKGVRRVHSRAETDVRVSCFRLDDRVKTGRTQRLLAAFAKIDAALRTDFEAGDT